MMCTNSGSSTAHRLGGLSSWPDVDQIRINSQERGDTGFLSHNTTDGTWSLVLGPCCGEGLSLTHMTPNVEELLTICLVLHNPFSWYNVMQNFMIDTFAGRSGNTEHVLHHWWHSTLICVSREWSRQHRTTCALSPRTASVLSEPEPALQGQCMALTTAGEGAHYELSQRFRKGQASLQTTLMMLLQIVWHKLHCW